MAATKPKAGAAGVSELAASVGLTDDDLIGMYRVIATARAVDERMWVLNRAGRIPFVISGQGHEGAQVGMTWALDKGKDWIAPFYRSIATCLTFGMRARDILTAQYAKAARGAGLGLDEISRARSWSSADPREAALLTFLKALFEDGGRPAHHLLEEARELDWSDEEILEAVAHVALNEFQSLMANAAALPQDQSDPTVLPTAA